MTNAAILIGMSKYDQLADLDCCVHDVRAIEALIRAAAKYDTIRVIQDVGSNELKTTLREELEGLSNLNELFFYFSGHGHIGTDDFFYCTRDYVPSKPHETGLGTEELHRLLRGSNAKTVVKVIDACASGKRIIKSDTVFEQIKGEFENFIQIASCLESQSSLTGDPLSLFTEAFCQSVLFAESGAVYYSDIVSRLRDRFIDNVDHVPYFVQQATGREVFVNDARLFLELRRTDGQAEGVSTEVEYLDTEPDEEISAVQQLSHIDQKCATEESANSFISTLANTLEETTGSAPCFSDFYEVETSKSSNYYDDTDEEYIVRVLSRQKRLDNLVSAEINARKERRPIRQLDRLLGYQAEYNTWTEYDLKLNCALSIAQLTMRLIPKFRCLGRLSAVVSFVPSLQCCFVFASCVVEPPCGWSSEYGASTKVPTRQWFQTAWDENATWISDKIFFNLKEQALAQVSIVTVEQ